MQIRYTHKLSMHKADFSQNREVCATFSTAKTQGNFLKFETVMHHTIDFPSIKSKLLLDNKIACASHF